MNQLFSNALFFYFIIATVYSDSTVTAYCCWLSQRLLLSHHGCININYTAPTCRILKYITFKTTNFTVKVSIILFKQCSYKSLFIKFQLQLTKSEWPNSHLHQVRSKLLLLQTSVCGNWYPGQNSSHYLNFPTVSNWLTVTFTIS
jgi:hypothetical protein